MFLGIIVMITALAISAVAIYYSVAGLVAIFAAAAVPIMIMGSVLEVGKLVTAVWLHRYWHQATWWLKTYLSASVIVLMFITSMGIFGFLSKAHIDQTATAIEGIAQIERIDLDIARQQSIVERADSEIVSIQTNGVTQDNVVQEQIDREQARIDTAYERIQPAIDEQLSVIEKAEADIQTRVATFESQLVVIEQKLSDLSAALAENNVRRAQGIIGQKQDGSLGPATSSAIQRFRETEENKRNELLERIEQIRTAPNPAVDAARTEISRLRSIAEQQIADSDELISRLRSQLGSVDVEQITAKIAEQEQKIADANATINTLTEQKYSLETEYRKLEAEVGPVKYLAEFVYGETADKDLLEEAVRWVIITIIFVFDPLAVLLLIASQYTFELHRKERNEKLAEQQREEKNNETLDRINDEEPTEQSGNNSIKHNDPEASDAIGPVEDAAMPGTGHEERDAELERTRELEEIEDSEDFRTAKQRWKDENPDKTIKEFKDAYIKGKIDELPWEGYVQNAEQSNNSIWQRIRNRNE